MGISNWTPKDIGISIGIGLVILFVSLVVTEAMDAYNFHILEFFSRLGSLEKESPEPTKPESPEPTKPESPEPTKPESPEPTKPESPEPTKPEPTQDGKPIAKISGPTWAKPFQVVEFSAEDSIDVDGTIMRYQWSFGDGTPATKKIVKHRYDSETIYEVTLNVWDNEKKNNSTTHEIEISHVNPITKLPDLSIPQDFKTFDKEDNYVINAGEEFSISGIIQNNNFPEVTEDICIKLEFVQFGRSQYDEICGYKIFNKPQIRFQFDLIMGFEGTYLLTFTIDPDNLIEETNEDNNITEYTLNIQ